MRILVRSPNWIGDQILAYPFFYYLRQEFPNAWISVATVPWVGSIQYKTLINEEIALPFPKSKSLWDRLVNLWESGVLLRSKGPWDLAISLPNSFSAAWQLFYSGATERRGYATDFRRLLLTQAYSWKKNEAEHLHRTESYVRLIDPVAEPKERRVLNFWGEAPENDLDPWIPGVVTSFDASEEWSDHKALEIPKHPYYIIAPGSAAESRRAPVHFFLELSKRIWEKWGWIGIIVGGVAEAKTAKDLMDSAAMKGIKLFDATGQGTVACLWNLFQESKLTLANDSGLAHVASLCQSPVYILWGAGDPQRTRPLGPGRVYFQVNPVECWPCEKNHCDLPGIEKLRCLKGLDLTELWGVIESEFATERSRETS